MTLINQRKCAFIVFLAFFMLLPFSSFAKVSGSPGDVLAELGSSKITRADFDREYKNFMKMANPQAVEHFSSPEGQKAFLGQLIELAVLMQKGEDLKLSATEEYAKLYEEAIIDQLAGEKLQDVINDVKVEESEAKKFYEENKAFFTEPESYHLYQITANSIENAEKAKKRIEGGESFLKVSKEESIDDSKDNGGDKGFVVAEDVLSEIGEQLQKLKKDELSRPIKLDDNNFAIVKYTENKPSVLKEFGVVAIQIKRDLLRKKQEVAFESIIEKMKNELAFELFLKEAEVLRRGTPLTEEEKKLVIVKCEGKEYALAEIEEELQQIPVFIRPQILAGEGLATFLKQFYSRILAFAYAKKHTAKLMEEFPKAKSDVERKVLVKLVYDKKMAEVAITDADVEKFYNENQDMFKQGASMKAHHILVADEAKAKELVETLSKEPAKFEEFAKSDSSCPSGQHGGDLGTFGEGQMVAEFDAVCKTAEIGKIVGPVKTQFGYHVIRVDERTPAGVLALNKVKDSIREQLLPERQREVFQTYVTGLQEEYKVKSYPENL
ncbi:MAG: peptidyl-prolyl cis-trans isomerase [Candidatus Riflebacteria bacterium]|nr:peptidyl-prolyl cis-trans isomerase [Candidatus Riflebacteria bacterium]